MERLIAVETKLITNEIRIPSSVRTNTSRPNLSVPNQCEPAPNGATARCCQSRESYAYGLTTGPTSANTARKRITHAATIATLLRRIRAAASLHKPRERRTTVKAMSFMTHARIEPSVHEIASRARQAEHCLNHQGTRDNKCGSRSDVADDRKQRRPQRVPPQNSP